MNAAQLQEKITVKGKKYGKEPILQQDINEYKRGKTTEVDSEYWESIEREYGLDRMENNKN